MKIELLEDFKHDDGTGLQQLKAGEIRVVGDNLGTTLCQMGLAKDVDGVVPTGERDVNKAHTIQPDPVAQPTNASEVK